MSDHDIKQGISLGLSKVNVATQLNQAFTDAIRGVLNRDGEMVDPRKYLAPGAGCSNRNRARAHSFLRRVWESTVASYDPLPESKCRDRQDDRGLII